MAEKVSRDEVIAFRLAAHHLSQRLGLVGLLGAAGRCGIQNSPPGSALLALHARVRDVTQDRVATAVGGDKSLLQSWCMRGAPYFFPTADAPVFTTGVLPPTETAMRHFMPGAAHAVDQLQMSLGEAAALCAADLKTVLSGRHLAVGELGRELAERVSRRLTPSQRTVWEGPGAFAPDQPLGEAVVHFCLRILTMQRVVCLAPRSENKAPFALVDEWLGHPIPDVDPDIARATLLRRYLRAYGPSTRADFAAWIGVNTGDVDRWWSLVDGELAPVEFAGTAWILAEDLDALRSAPRPEGVRLLPPRDPYTQLRDRDTIVAREHRAEVWRAVGEPGAVLLDGRVAGIWRPRKSGRRLTLTVTPFDSLPPRAVKLIHDEAEQIATLRGAFAVEVLVASS